MGIVGRFHIIKACATLRAVGKTTLVSDKQSWEQKVNELERWMLAEIEFKRGDL